MNKYFNVFLLLACLVTFAFTKLHAQSGKPVSWQDFAQRKPASADHTIYYGSDSLQFGELRLPKTKGKVPVVVLIHGGCWLAQFNYQYMSHMAEALTNAGFATWSLEYRRVGDPGGGWPGTFQDVAQGTDYVRELAKQFPLDISRVIITGHSAGGHLALWLAGRGKLSEKSPLYTAKPLPLIGVVSLAGITDLAAYGAAAGSCNAAVPKLMGGGANEFATRYAQASPVLLLPMRIPQRLLQGKIDPIVPLSQSEVYTARAQAQGDDVEQWLLEEAGHFDLVAPFSPLWPTVEKAFFSLLSLKKARDGKPREEPSRK